MQQRIIYPQAGGPIAIVTPLRVAPVGGETAADALLRHARSVVPDGVPFLVVEAAALPVDRAWRNAWVADFSAPDGHGGEA